MREPVAAIDCGTNSIRLLIARPLEDGGLEPLAGASTIVRLGQGVDATGELNPEAIGRTFAALDRYAEAIVGHGVRKVRFVATSATRDARNRSVFVDGVRERLGIEPEVVSGDEEAALSFAGASLGLDRAAGEPFMVVDLGGGSTELVLGGRDGVSAAHSMDIGCVRMTERRLVSDPPTEDEVAAASEDIDEAIAAALRDVPAGRVGTLVGVAGSITTVTAHALGLDSYDSARIHGATLTFDRIREAAWDLVRMARGQRAALPYMHPGRVDVIGAGALVWIRITEMVERETEGRVDRATASETDILHGIALSLLEDEKERGL